MSACRVSVVKPEVLERIEAAGLEVFVHRADYERDAARVPTRVSN